MRKTVSRREAAVGRGVAPHHPRGPRDQPPRRSRRRLRQDADARRAHGCRDRVRRLPGRAPRRRHLHAQGRVGAARPVPPGAGDDYVSRSSRWLPASARTEERASSSARSATSSAFSPAPSTRFCARLLRERPVESGVSPGFTELDEVQDEELRNRSWRDFIANTRSAGDPDMLALLETGVRPPDLESAFAIICGNEDVEFPPGDGVCPDPKPAWKALEKFWAKLEKLLPDALDEDTNCEIQKAARQFRAQMRVARKKLSRPATHRGSARRPGTASRRSSRSGGPVRAPSRSGSRREIEQLHGDFRAETVTPYLARGGSTSIGCPSRCSRARATSPPTSAAGGTR